MTQSSSRWLIQSWFIPDKVLALCEVLVVPGWFGPGLSYRVCKRTFPYDAIQYLSYGLVGESSKMESVLRSISDWSSWNILEQLWLLPTLSRSIHQEPAFLSTPISQQAVLHILNAPPISWLSCSKVCVTPTACGESTWMWISRSSWKLGWAATRHSFGFGKILASWRQIFVQ